MTYLIEQLINGICQGAIYALFAIGYTIIVGVVGLVSFTFGEVIMIGAFAALFTATLTGGNILLTRTTFSCSGGRRSVIAACRTTTKYHVGIS